MSALNKINMEEFQKCGVMLVAARRNKFVMSCSFCQEIFEQLQTFVRHLQLQHSDKLDFVKQDKNVEIYAVEELMNKTTRASCAPDIRFDESGLAKDDANWLSVADMKWLDEGVKPKKKQESHADQQTEEGLNKLCNLQSSEECKQESFQNTLMEEIYNDWEDSDTNESVQSVMAITNVTKPMMAISKHLDEDLLSFTETALNSTSVEENESNCIKSLLQGIEDMNDIDTLLANLEKDSIKIETKIANENVTKKNFYCKNMATKNHKLKIENHVNNDKVLLNTILDQKFNQNMMDNKLLPNISLVSESEKVDCFETRLGELEDAIDEDILNSNQTEIKNSICAKIVRNTKAKCSKQNNFEIKLKDLRYCVNDDNACHNYIIDKNKVRFTDDGKQQENSKEALSVTEMNIQTTSVSETPVKEDLSKVLADALDNDIDLLNLHLEKENEEPLNDDILNLLERELVENETNPLHKEMDGVDDKITTSLNQQKCENKNEINIKTKYQKTNIKAKTKIYEKQKKCLVKLTKCSLLKTSNGINNDHIAKDSEKILKINRTKIYRIENSKQKMFSNLLEKKETKRETQENYRPTLDIRYVKPTQDLNFTNISLKGSRKMQEKNKNSFNITPNPEEKTPLNVKTKANPRTQENQEDKIPENTPPEIRQKSLHLKTEDFYEQQICAKTPKIPNLATKETKSKRHLKCITINSDEKSGSSKKSLKKSAANTPLRTPQRIKSLSIKLERFTPDKLSYVLKNSQRKLMEDEAKKIAKDLKLPKGISLTVVPKAKTTIEKDICKVVETPIKGTNWQQRKEIQNDNTTLDKPTISGSKRNIVKKLKQTEYKIRRRMPSIDILPRIQRKPEKDSQISTMKTQRHSNLDHKSYAINRSCRKQEVLQNLRNIKKQIIKSLDESECVTKTIDMKSPAVMTKHKKLKVSIKNITILPKLKNDELASLNLKEHAENITTTATTTSPSLKNLTGDQKQSKMSLQHIAKKNDSQSNCNNKNLIKSGSKRSATSPLLNEKHGQKFPEKKQNDAIDKISELETAQFDLSESVVEFLQCDLKENRINVERLINKDLAVDDCSPNNTSLESNSNDGKVIQTPKDDTDQIINDLLQQVEEEKSVQKKIEERDCTSPKTLLLDDLNELKDINLLTKFGLKIIKCSQLDDIISPDECNEMQEKAKKFANIYKNCPRFWAARKGNNNLTMKEDLAISFQLLLTQINASFNLDIIIAEVKRLVNLINSWYTHTFNTKLTEKQTFSPLLQRYLLMFKFIPKTIKCLYFCEDCEEYFNAEHKYRSHRIMHTGILHSYTCQTCSIDLKTLKQLKDHELICNLSVLNTSGKSPVKSTLIKCPVCSKIFSNCELLYEHSKKHLKKYI